MHAFLDPVNQCMESETCDYIVMNTKTPIELGTPTGIHGALNIILAIIFAFANPTPSLALSND
jgi:hypothetical protein